MAGPAGTTTPGYPKTLWTPRRAVGSDATTKQRWNVTCSRMYETANGGRVAGCHTDQCGRVVIDDFITKEEKATLLALVNRGMTFASAKAAKGGPTIMDVNTGFVRDQYQMVNMYEPTQKGVAAARFTEVELGTYRAVMERIRQRIIAEFGTQMLYLTAPTFVTREVGAKGWQPSDMHDVYWHPHIDKQNTEHYDFSGLLYLADHQDDFEGGKFAFIDGVKGFQQQMPCIDQDLKRKGAPNSCVEYAKAGYCKMKAAGGTISDACPKSCKKCDPNETDSGAPRGAIQHTVEPMSGRLVLFTSGSENLHQVKRVTRGTRFVMSMWFTCNKNKEFNPDHY